MKDWIADRLLMLSSWFNTWSRGCKNAAIRVLLSRPRPVQPRRTLAEIEADLIAHKHTEINS